MISYFCETWLSEVESDLLHNINSNYCIFSRSEFYIKPLRGRPYGGTAWSIHKDIIIENVEFINEHISYIDCKFKGNNLLIIGTYMPYDDRSNETRIYYVSILSLILALINSYRLKQDYSIIIGGDFNASIWRNNRFDYEFLKFLEQSQLIPVSALFTQKINHTYTKN